MDAALVWKNIVQYGVSGYGSTSAEIQKNLRKKYNDAGSKILVSAFGATEFPTSKGLNATTCGRKLAQFVIDNNLDGADADWEDNAAMNNKASGEAGPGAQWIIEFTKAYRAVSPDTILAHAPLGPYFSNTFYASGAYNTVDKEVGSMIDFYFVQFYNQGDTKYNTYEELFTKASGTFAGTSVK